MDSIKKYKTHRSFILLGLAIVLLIYSFFIYFYLARINDNLSRLFFIGENYINPKEFDLGYTYLKDSDGYDGEFYLRFALEPFNRSLYVHGIRVSNPPYRHQRILLPLLVHLVSLGGDPQLIPAVYLVINLLALCIVAWVGMAYAQAHGIHPLWGISAALLPGFVFCITHNLTEILEIAFVAMGLWTYSQKRYRWTSLWLVCAVLTKETSLVFPVGLLLQEFFIEGKFKLKKLHYVLGIPILVYIIWQVFIYIYWGTLSINVHSTGNFGIPFAGIIHFLQTYFPWNNNYDAFCAISFLCYGTLLVISLMLAPKSFGFKIPLFLYVIVLVTGSSWIWVESTFLRTSLELSLLSTFIGLTSPKRIYTIQRLLGIALFLFQIIGTCMFL
ncbi:MAG: hypothetical protein LLG44_04765 [Chloroflexi bacterium]|nr:hypothetical protein [Chloroflexota bacterium]